MKNYKIYEDHNSGAIVSIKDGWSWPAFFFTFIWCFVKKLYMIGIGLVIYIVISEIIIANNNTIEYDYYGYAYYEESGIAVLFYLINLGIGIWLGVTGNEKRCDYYESVGFNYQGIVTAVNPDAAIATYARGAGSQASDLYSNDNTKHQKRKGGS